MSKQLDRIWNAVVPGFVLAWLLMWSWFIMSAFQLLGWVDRLETWTDWGWKFATFLILNVMLFAFIKILKRTERR